MPSATSTPFVVPGKGRAPILSVPPVEIVAVEHPMVVKNLDNAMKTFGRGLPFKQMMDPACAEDILPLYLRPNDPSCSVLESHVATTSNVVLKITVPKRTGRKRKRGSQGPFLEDENSAQPVRLDASTVFQSLADNVDKYQVEPLGMVNLTHRYRGMADFHKSTINSPFMNRFNEQVLSGNLETFKSFKFDPSRGFKLNEDVIPPPFYSESNLPYPWAYQKGFATTDADTSLLSGPARIPGVFSHDLSLPIPTGPRKQPPEKYKPLVDRLRECFEIRPIWTKRAIENMLRDHNLFGEVKAALPFVSYQFHGGPWRDSNIKFGVDPRQDAQYRMYQTVTFKVKDLTAEYPDFLRSGWVMSDLSDDAVRKRKWRSHVFDGESFSMDGRIWQICDITDPLLSKVFSTDTIREVPDLKQDGWYCNGTFAKARGIMRTKIRALQTGKKLSDEDFIDAMKLPEIIMFNDDTKAMPYGKSIRVPLPKVAIRTRVGVEKEWSKTKKQKHGRDMTAFRTNGDHGAQRGKSMNAKELQQFKMATGMDHSARQSIETSGGDNNNFATLGSQMTEEGNIVEEEGDSGDEDDDDDANIDLDDDSSLDYGSVDDADDADHADDADADDDQATPGV